MPRATAKVNGVVIAETDVPQVAHGDVYFPLSCINWQYFTPNPLEAQRQVNPSVKGKQIHFTLEVNGTTLRDAAWMYASPSEKLSHIKDHIAFHNYAPLMLKYKKDFQYARLDTSDTASVCSSLSSPASSTPTTPTSTHATPALFFNSPATCNPRPTAPQYFVPPLARNKDRLMFGGCLGGSLVNQYQILHRNRMLSTVPEVEYRNADGGFGIVRIVEEA